MSQNTQHKETASQIPASESHLLHRLVIASNALCKKLEEIHEDKLYQSVWSCAWIHGIDYSNGLKYENELRDLKDILNNYNARDE